MQKINWAWRLFGTALGFFFFGLGGLLLRVLVFPVLKLVSAPDKLQARSRLMVHCSLKAHIWLLVSLGALELKVEGVEKLNGSGQLLLANHPCLLDVVFLFSLIRDTNCIVKHSLWVNPFTRGPVVNAGYISNGDSKEMIDESVNALRSGQNLVIFPEGTRTTPDRPLRFQRGAAQIALRSGVPVIPIVIYGELPALTKQQKWYQIPERKMSYTISVGDPMDLSAQQSQDSVSLLVRRATEFLETYFTEELKRYDRTGKRTEATDHRYA